MAIHFFVTTTVLEAARDRIAEIAPGSTYTVLDEQGHLSGDELRGTQVVFLSSDLLEWLRQNQAVQAAILRALSESALAWVQTASTGIEHPIFGALRARGVRVTNAPGIHAEPIAEYVFAHLLALAKRVREHSALQARREYSPLDADELTGKTLGIVGYGGIGRATARRARAFGMRVVAVRRSPGSDDFVDQMLPPEGLDELLRASDVVLVAVPLTPETKGLIDAARLATMRSDAVLVNVARGAVVDERALIDALQNGRLRAAILDVQEHEPLPATSPLWGLERCIVTAHDSARSPRTFDRAVAYFLDNLRRYVDGAALAGDSAS